MPFSIQTNVNSLVAQENLYTNSQFQSKTIDELTSGYRINQSGDDAAGLAIANKFRNDTAELTQGVSNANDGVAELQIMDGGMSNIGTMLDRLQTLATQSASQSFTGNRTVLNNEYQGLVSEIDRQAQSIGLSTGGHFAQNLNIYVGGGETISGADSTQNGMVALGLSNSAVDSKALGLRTGEFVASSAAGTNLAQASNTSVANIVNSNGATATFELSGAGFSNMQVSVNLTTGDTTQTVAQALNAAIQAIGNNGTAAGSALRNANIQVSSSTDSAGDESLSFTSATGAFQVAAGSATANALLGNFAANGATAATGAAVSQAVTGATMTVPSGAPETVNLKVLVNGQAVNLAVAIAGNEGSNSELLGDITGSGTYSSLTALGVTASVVNGKLQFQGDSNQSIQVESSGDTNNYLGLGAWSASSNVQTAGTGATNNSAGSATVQFSINGGQAIDVNFSAGATLSDTEQSLQNAINANSELAAAGLTVGDTAGTIAITSGSATVQFRMNVVSQSGGLDLGYGTGAASTATLSSVDTAAQISSQGASATGLGTNNEVFSFNGLTNLGGYNNTTGSHADQQVLSFSADDANGNLQSTSITLDASHAGDVDQAVNWINSQLQASGNATLKQIVAVKETNSTGTGEGIRFISSLNSFSVNVGNATNSSTANPVGLYDGTSNAASTQGMTVNSSSSGAIDISTVAGALQAVTAVSNAVQQLGLAQAAVGRGENQLNYAIDLANSQITNYSSAESDLRDANIATEAANLTKAQVLQQASIAAMAQANSAPQAILSLLRG